MNKRIMSNLNSFFKIENNLKVLFIIFLTISIMIIYLIDRSMYNYHVKIISSSNHKKDSAIYSEINKIQDVYIAKNKKDSAIYSAQNQIQKDSLANYTKLINQYNIIQEIKWPYFYIAAVFGASGYGFTMIFTFCSIVTAILAFLIVNRGWGNTNNFYLKSSFLVFFFFSTLSGVLQKVSNSDENVKKNIEKYYYYNGLQIDIFNLISNNKVCKSEQIDSLFSLVNNSIKNNSEIFFDIDIDKVPSEFETPINNLNKQTNKK